MIRSRKMKWVRVCSTHDSEVYARFWNDNLKERDIYEDSGTDGRIILRWIFKK
jgi:hypothetical protein